MNLELTKEDSLFSSKKKFFKGQLQQISVSEAFTEKNKKLREHHIKIIDEKIKNGEISKEDKQKAIEKIPKFHAHACRKYFETMISRNCGDLRICSLIEGHVSPMKTDPSYIKIDDNDVYEAYMAAIPDLSLENTETKVYTSDVRREMEEKINELENKNEELQNTLTKQQSQIMERIAALENKSDDDILDKYR